MMLKPPMDLATFETKAGQVAYTLKAIGNARRLVLLCKLVEHGEMTVGALLGAFVAPAFLALSAFVGTGLMFAGVTGWCGMASLLRIMPWNRRAAGQS